MTNVVRDRGGQQLAYVYFEEQSEFSLIESLYFRARTVRRPRRRQRKICVRSNHQFLFARMEQSREPWPMR
jgi:hypothetical protein